MRRRRKGGSQQVWRSLKDPATNEVQAVVTTPTYLYGPDLSPPRGARGGVISPVGLSVKSIPYGGYPRAELLLHVDTWTDREIFLTKHYSVNVILHTLSYHIAK